MTVSVSEDSDDDLGEKLREYLEKDILCVIIGSYIQCQMTGYFRLIVSCIFLKKEMRRYSLLLTLVPRKTDTAIKDWNFDYFEECVSLGYL